MNSDAFRLVPAGDSTLIVEFADRIDPVISEKVIALASAIQAAGLVGIRDVAPTYRSVAIHFDPLRADYRVLTTRVRAEAAAVESIQAVPAVPLRVPVCYGGEFGPDLPDVAKFANISEAEVIQRHSARTYRVFMLGFVPGFAYMGIVDECIAMPRLAVPRVRVPPGSVGIAGVQTGVYPCATPGGWRLVGRTPVEPFDLDRVEPFLFKPGDAVNFYAIDQTEYRERSR